MWKVERPTVTAAQAFATCVGGIKDSELRARLESVAPVIHDSETIYEFHALTQTLNLIAKSETVGGAVTKKEMSQLYETRMAAKTGAGRGIYEKLKMLPKGDRCPFCGQRNISTLDHILPKASFPDLAVTPINLVGCCAECNKAKLAFSSTAPEATPLHPYFDDLTELQWLKARVIAEPSCPVVFFVAPPSAWDATTHARVQAQFERLKLSFLYASQAAREIANIAYNLKLYLEGEQGPAEVQRELVRQWHSRRANSINSWQTALYEALAADYWFYTEGFLTCLPIAV